jgi:hypothetical protein
VRLRFDVARYRVGMARRTEESNDLPGGVIHWAMEVVAQPGTLVDEILQRSDYASLTQRLDVGDEERNLEIHREKQHC